MGTATAASPQASPARPRAAAAFCGAPAASGKIRVRMLARRGATASQLFRLAPSLETANGLALLPHQDRAPGRVQRSADEHGGKPFSLLGIGPEDDHSH